MPGLPLGKARPKWTWKEARLYLQLNALEQGKPSCEAPFGADTILDGSGMESRFTKPIHVTHRGAIVCTYQEDGTTVLNPARLRWKSIRDRINVYTKATVFQRGGQWFLGTPDGHYPFVDAMVVDDRGLPVGRKAEAPEASDGLKVCPTCNGDGTVSG